MVTARPINVERALVDPRAVFQEPVEVLACADLDEAHKRQILECWRQDALELQAADDEAMTGGEEPMLKRVLDRRPAPGPLSGLSWQRGDRLLSAACWRHLPKPPAPASTVHVPCGRLVRCAARGSDLHERGLGLAIVQV
jgi:hypothetical protein